LSQIISDLRRPNGIALSPDESVLYVADPGINADRQQIMKYDLPAPGQPTNPRVFAHMFADGLKVDPLGDLFAATYYGFAAWRPDGTQIVAFHVDNLSLELPEATTNVAFADPAAGYPNTLYITAGHSLYRATLQAMPPGDLNGDGTVNDLDIDPFALLLTDAGRYARQFGLPPLVVGDINADGRVNNLDIDPFAALLTGGGAAAVPEPATLLLAAMGTVALAIMAKHGVCRDVQFETERGC
jgi:hypothetical protein